MATPTYEQVRQFQLDHFQREIDEATYQDLIDNQQILVRGRVVGVDKVSSFTNYQKSAANFTSLIANNPASFIMIYLGGLDLDKAIYCEWNAAHVIYLPGGPFQDYNGLDYTNVFIASSSFIYLDSTNTAAPFWAQMPFQNWQVIAETVGLGDTVSDIHVNRAWPD